MDAKKADEILRKSGEAMAAGKTRELPGIWGKLISGLAVAFSLLVLLYAGDAFEYFGLRFFGSYRALAYAFALLLVFLHVVPTLRSRRDRVPWYDLALGLGAAAGSFYVFSHWESQVESYATPTLLQMVLGGIVLLATLEACRRTLGWALTIIGIFFILYTLFGNYFPGFLFTKGYSYSRMLGHYYLSATGLYGSAMEVFTVVIAAFMVFAQFVQVSGCGDFFLRIGLSIVGRFRGGPAKVAVFSSSLFGTVSGSAVANVVIDGGITIPMMKKVGYRPEVAAAVEAAASNGGQIMPPVMGAAAFLMADILGIPYWGVVMAAFLPAVFYYVALYFMLDFEAAKTNIKGLPRVQIPSLWTTLKEGGHFLIPIFVLVYFIGYLGYSAQKSALYSLLALVAVSYIRKETRLSPRQLWQTMEKGGHITAQFGPAAGAIGILMSAITLTGLGVTLATGLIQASGGHLIVLLLLTAGAALIMGMGVSTLMVYVVLALFVAPAIIQMGVMPIAAHLFVFYFGMMSLLTPPVALAAYAAAAIAGSDYWKTGWQATRMGIVGYIVPFIFVYQPAMLLKGPAEAVALAVVSGLLGVVSLAGAMTGYMLTTTRWWERAVLGVGAILLIIPGWKTDLIGLALLVIPILHQVRVALSRRAAARALPQASLALLDDGISEKKAPE